MDKEVDYGQELRDALDDLVAIKEQYHEQWMLTQRELVELKERLLEVHRDGGPSQGFFAGGYGFYDHCCTECGSFGEYGVKWPCWTVLTIRELEQKYLDMPDES